MQQTTTPEAWGKENRNITALQDPVGEFNARGGVDLAGYLALQAHIDEEHPNLGKEQWVEIQSKLPPIEFIKDPESNQRLRVQLFNWPEDREDIGEQTVTIFNLPFSVPIDLEHLEYQHYCIAEAIGTPFMVIENPGYGKSDKLTTTQKSALKKDGDFGPIAETMLGIAKSLGVKTMNCVGYSMGADVAAAIAAHAAERGITVESLFVMESPREVEQKPLKLGKDFGSDAKNLKFAWKHPVDPVLREVAKLGMGLPKGLLTYGRALYKGGLQTDIETALTSQPNMKLIDGRAGSSKISSREANRGMIGVLSNKFPDRHIRRIVMPGESHAYGDSAKRYANLVRLVLR